MMQAGTLDSELIPLRAARNLPELPKRPSLNAITRWAITGLKGHRLRTLCVGRQRFTSARWLFEFFEAVAAGPAVAQVPRDETPAAPRMARGVELNRARARVAQRLG